VNENETTGDTGPSATAAQASNVASHVASGLSNMTTVGADRVFREPVHVGERVVITAAAFDISGGMGFGSGADIAGNGGGGGGAGAHTEGRPVAAIAIGPDGVTIRPIIDFTRIGVTLLIGAFAIWRAGRR
jgi:uncharacterized spore protein YtfJ